MHARWILPLMVLVSACATGPQRGEVLVRPLDDAEIASLGARPACGPAITAVRKVDRNFKYGCFCGGGHPGFTHPSGLAESALSAAQRKELALTYYGVEPFDDIDAACQAHDVCWLLNGEGNARCNRALFERMDYLYRQFDDATLPWARDEEGHWETAKRCAALSGDIFLSSTVMAEKVGEDSIFSVIHSAFRLGGYAMVPAAYSVVEGGARAGLEYPRPGERCDLPRTLQSR